MPIFVLEFHLPYLVLRDRTKISASSASGMHYDLSFLEMRCTDPETHDLACTQIIQEAQVSIVVCGFHNLKWVAWAFIKTPSDRSVADQAKEQDDESERDCAEFQHDENEQVKEEEKGEDDGDDDEEGDDDVDVREDHFAGDGEEGLVLETDVIWDARRYWLKIISIRVRSVLKESQWVVQNVAVEIERCVSMNFSVHRLS